MDSQQHSPNTKPRMALVSPSPCDMSHGHAIPVASASSQLDGAAREARRAWIEGELGIGTTLLRLHSIDSQGECSCKPWSSTRVKSFDAFRKGKKKGIIHPCQNAGKHLMTTADKAVMTDVEDIEAHMDAGGGIGICLRVDGVPECPIRRVVFDCDREGSQEWLERHGIRSAYEVYGRRGKHVVGVLPEDCPDLYSNTHTLNPGSKHPTSETQPGIDLKVSGLVVAPFSPNKRLVLNGVDISCDPVAVRALYCDPGSLKAFLPNLDPRVLVPTMRVYVPPMTHPNPEAPIKGTKKMRKKAWTLSDIRPHQEDCKGAYAEFPYYARKEWARRYLRYDSPVAEPGSHSEWELFKTVAILRHRFSLSETDMLRMVERHYNRRCMDAEGAPSPFRKGVIAYKIIKTRDEGGFDPLWKYLDTPGVAALKVKIRAGMKTQGIRSNKRRSQHRSEEKSYDWNLVGEFLREECVIDPQLGVRTKVAELWDSFTTWTEARPSKPMVKEGVFYKMLRKHGIRTRRHDHRPKTYAIDLALRSQLPIGKMGAA